MSLSICRELGVGCRRGLLAVMISIGSASCAGPSSNASDAYEAGRQALLDNDYETAFKEFTIAAERGDARAQAHIARMYYDGRHVPRNYVLAYAWFHLAMAASPDAVTGDQATMELLKIKMSPAELEEGEAELARLTREVTRSATEDSAQWRTIPPEQADLVVSVPTLERSRGVYGRSVEGFVVREYAVWSDAGASASTAEIIFSRVKPIGPKTLVFIRNASLEEEIHRMLPRGQLSFGRIAKMSNRIGEAEYQRFTRDGTRECLYIRQFADTFADERGYTLSFEPTAGNITIRGWYCAPPEVTLSHETMEVFVKGLGVREFAVPEHDAND